mgnify:CR=1 FL=1
MKRRISWIVLALALIAAACGDDDDGTATTAPAATETTQAPATTVTTPATTQAPPSTTEPVGANPLVIAAVDFEAGVIEIRNDGETPYDPAGHWLCNRPDYLPFPEGVIDPGASITISTQSLNVLAKGGEIGIYTARAFENADEMVRYVRWGDASAGRASVAAFAGLWPEGDVVDNAGGAIVSIGSNPVSSADWSVS